MDWLRENLHWVFIILALIWMHTRMHGAHGGHGGCGGSHGQGSEDDRPESHR